MKGPADADQETEEAGAAPPGMPRRRRVSGKALLRRNQFLDQRGLSWDAPAPSPTGGVELDEEEPAGDVRRSVTAARPRAAGEVPAPYLAGAREKEALLPETAAAGVHWRELGPVEIPQGQTYGSGPGGRVAVAGRVAAIAVDPEDGDHLLVGAAAGGVWETHDGGQSWAPRTDDQPTLSIGAIAFDPSDRSRVYAATGEGNSEYASLGQGILVSDNGGSSWTIVAQERFAGVGFYRLVVDPGNSDRLLAATTRGAFLSSNGGTDWEQFHEQLTWDVSLASPGSEPEVLLAAADGLFAALGSGTPTRIALPGLPPMLDLATERMAVTHVPADPGQAFVFAAAQGRPRLWHRVAADQPFVALALPSFPNPPYLADVLNVEQAAYDWYVGVPPGTTEVVYLGAIELVKGEQASLGPGSVEAGWPSTPVWTDISSRHRVGDSIHPDQHTMAFDPQDPNIIYAGNDGGVFRSQDAGGTWQSLNAGLGISEVEFLSQRPDDRDWILAGLQDNGTIRRQDERRWRQVALGDGGDCGINTAAPDVCYHSYYYMAMERSSNGGDPGSWVDVTPPDSDWFRQLFYPPLEVNEQVVVKAGEVVCVSSDGGDTWTQVPLPPSDGRPSVASALAIPSRDRLLAGTIRGDVFRIDRRAGGWGAPVKLRRPTAGWISDLLVDPDAPDRHWATFSMLGGAGAPPMTRGAVFRSDNRGAAWTDVTAGLPHIPVNAVVTDPSDSDRVWVACDVGVFESRNAGGSWSPYGTGLPNALAVDLLFYEPDRLLRVGTRNRGVWEATVD